MEVVFIVVVLLLNEPILSIMLMLLLEIALCRGAQGLGFLAGQEVIDVAAILRLLPSVLGSARVGHWYASLIGCTRSWSVLERLMCRTLCRRIFQSQGSCWRLSAPPPPRCVPPVRTAGGGEVCEPELQNVLVQVHGDPLRRRRGRGGARAVRPAQSAELGGARAVQPAQCAGA